MPSRWRSKPFLRKPLWAFEAENDVSELKRVFGFWSLLAIGVGGTVGSGIFVMSGQIASTMAGPATALSFLIAGFICAITAVAYAELASILMSPGSTYSFASFGLGEALAVVAGFLVTLEYGVSGAAVSRSWGDKLNYWLTEHGWIECEPNNCWVNALGGTVFNPASFLLSSLMVGLILMGASVEKTAVNILVTFKVALVLFVIICGAVYVDPANLTPFVPPPGQGHNGTALEGFQGGFQGVMMGATAAFFSFIGFDEVTCMVGEATNPKKDIPLAVLGTIFIITLMYMGASIVLTGMAPYDIIDQSEGFGSAFSYVGAQWAADVTVAGEVFLALPSVVLVSYIPQSRIFYAMSHDGHLPRIFAKQNKKGNLFYGGLISGSVMTLIAGFVPFANLNDLISGGILLSFILTNTSLLMVRTEHKANKPILFYVICSALLTFIINKTDVANDPVALGFALLFGVHGLEAMGYMAWKYDFSVERSTFTVPFVPFIPCVSIVLNWFLLTQLSWVGIAEVCVLIVVAVLVYAFYGYSHAVDFEQVSEKEQLESQVAFGSSECDENDKKGEGEVSPEEEVDTSRPTLVAHAAIV